MTYKPIETTDPLHRDILRMALKSRATPFQSGFYVNSAALTTSGLIIKSSDTITAEKITADNCSKHEILGSNHEYAITSALHGEESLVANWAEQCDHNDLIKVIGFASEQDPTSVISSCGNCRDILRDVTHPEGYIIDGNPEGKMFIIPFKAQYFSDFKISKTFPYSSLIKMATSALDKSYDYTVSDKSMIYGVSILSKSGEVFSGSFEGDVAYHPILPIRNAETLIKYSQGLTKERLSIDHVVVVQHKKPDVPYKDRQYLTEFLEATQSFLEQEKHPIPIYLVELSPQGNPISSWETNSDEWLPMPFSPSALGLENLLAGTIAKLFNK